MKFWGSSSSNTEIAVGATGTSGTVTALAPDGSVSQRLARANQTIPDADAGHFHGPGKCVAVRVHQEAVASTEMIFVEKR